MGAASQYLDHTVAHSFLVEPGSWSIEGAWNKRDGRSTNLKGKTLVSWGKDNWFALVTKLVFEGEYPDIIFRYKGNFDRQSQRYTFVLEHSLFGKSEGEGWLTSSSILQRYWALKDSQRRNCFDTLYRIDRQSYHWSSATLSGPRLTAALEATLTRIHV